MNSNEIVFIHFREIDLYPPIKNIISLIEKKGSSKNIIVLSTSKTKKLRKSYENIEIIEISAYNKFKLIRLMYYLRFYFYVLFWLLKKQPKKIIYFESISALPAVIYKYFFSKCKIYAHYHEYTTKEEYKMGMSIERFNHWFEKKKYDDYCWISQTNLDRLVFFKNDHNILNLKCLHIMPNYPLSTWAKMDKRFTKLFNKKINLIYIGALSFEDTYIKEICEFIIHNPNSYSLDIYSNNLKMDVFDYLSGLKKHNIHFWGDIDYDNIPNATIHSHIGLILYKGNTINYIYNAPNKLFEYLACNLDVCFPKEMLGCYQYISKKNQLVYSIDFNNLNGFKFQHGSGNLIISNSNSFIAEISTKDLIEDLLD